MDDLNLLRQLYDLPTVVERFTGIEARRSMVCPMPFHTHTSNTPSFGMFIGPDGIQRFKCFGQCGAQGDVIDFCGYYTLGSTYSSENIEHLQVAIAHLRGQAICAQKTPLQTRRKPLDQRIARLLINQWENALWESPLAMDYLEKRGILPVARRFHLGYNHKTDFIKYEGPNGTVDGHYLSIPTFANGRILSIKLRRIDTHPDYKDVLILPIRYDSVAGNRIGTSVPGIFNHDAVAFQSGKFFSPEGEMDVMLIESLGFPACSMNSGAGVLTEQWGLLLAHASMIYIEDNDPAGCKHTLAKQQAKPGVIVKTEPYRDFGDLYHDSTQGKEKALSFLQAAWTL